MDALLLKLRLLAKAEMVLFRLHLRRTLRQAALGLGAVLAVIMALGMMNIALYQYLLPRWEGAGAALAVALVDLGVAAVLLIAAGQQQLDREHQAANELREQIIADLSADASRVSAQVTELQDDIRQIRTTASSIFNPGGLNIGSILQWVVLLVRNFRR